MTTSPTNPLPASPRTITWSELNRLSFCNSPKLPRRVNVAGYAKEWVGIGWIECGPAKPEDVVVLEDA